MTPRRIADAGPPRRGPRRWLFRAPVALYRIGLGGLLGRRFLLLTHRGRVTGQPRHAVLEVVDRTGDGGYLVASGFGPGAQWYRNVTRNPDVEVRVGRRVTAVTARPLDPEQSGRAMARYATAHPRAARGIVRLCGYTVDGTTDDYYAMGHDHIPFVALEPRLGR